MTHILFPGQTDHAPKIFASEGNRIRRVKKLKFLIFLLSISENMQLTHINQIKTKKIDFGCRIIPIFLVFCRRDIIYHVCISLKTSQWPYHAYFSSKLKNKTTFFSSTLKVGENKVVLFFHFELKWGRCSHFYVSQLLTFKTKILKLRKWPYLAYFSSQWKK